MESYPDSTRKRSSLRIADTTEMSITFRKNCKTLHFILRLFSTILRTSCSIPGEKLYLTNCVNVNIITNTLARARTWPVRVFILLTVLPHMTWSCLQCVLLTWTVDESGKKFIQGSQLQLNLKMENMCLYLYRHFKIHGPSVSVFSLVGKGHGTWQVHLFNGGACEGIWLSGLLVTMSKMLSWLIRLF